MLCTSDKNAPFLWLHYRKITQSAWIKTSLNNRLYSRKHKKYQSLMSNWCCNFRSNIKPEQCAIKNIMKGLQCRQSSRFKTCLKPLTSLELPLSWTSALITPAMASSSCARAWTHCRRAAFSRAPASDMLQRNKCVRLLVTKMAKLIFHHLRIVCV